MTDALDNAFNKLTLSEHSDNDQELNMICNDLREKDQINTKSIFEKITKQTTLTAQCLMVRKYLAPQSTMFETICKKHLKIDKKVDETSGDGCKDGITYEIKVSVHANKSKLNFVQLRPDHNVDYYIFIAYNMYEKGTSIGKAYILKIPSDVVYDLVIKYGGYAHGTVELLGKITKDNLKGRNAEFALRCQPNAKKGSKDHKLWNELKKYEVTYDAENFN